MKQIVLTDETARGLEQSVLRGALEEMLADCGTLMRVLLVVPDHTRMHSNAGWIANTLYHLLRDKADVRLLAALGTHVPMTQEQTAGMYGDIPYDRFIMHDWRNDVVPVGEIPGDFVARISEGVMEGPIQVEINRHLLDPSIDLILSVGQVVPHEVVGMANYSKNILVGCGGSDMINQSHMLGAFYGLERIMGRDHSPVRRVFDYAQELFLSALPLQYLLTVTTAPGGDIRTHGLFIGGGRAGFERAVALSARLNFIRTKPLQKVVVYLDPAEFNSTWLGNKSIYRTRMAIADGGELVVLAPGVDKFGEDPENDRLIRKYGYTGRENIIRQTAQHTDLQLNLSAAAHLIHGSSDGRFSITYCTRHLSKDEVEGAGFAYLPYDEAAALYPPDRLRDGFNTLPQAEIYYISNPALGLWMAEGK